MNVKYAKYCEFELTPENCVIIVDNWLNEIIFSVNPCLINHLWM